MNGIVKITTSWGRMVGHLAANGETPDDIEDTKAVLRQGRSRNRRELIIGAGTAQTGTLGQYILYCPRIATMVLILSGEELTSFLHENGTPAHNVLGILMAARPGNPAIYGRATIEPIQDDTATDREYMVTVK